MNSLNEYFDTFKDITSLTILGPQDIDLNFTFQEPVIYVDGGSRHKCSGGIIVGDGDSSIVEVDIKLPVSKNYSDLKFVLDSIPSSVKEIQALGFLGGRKDHELINWGEFFNFLSKREQCRLILSQSITLFSPGNYEVKIQGGFSLINYQTEFIKISGDCEYAYSGQPESSHSSQFLSNIGHGLVNINSESAFSIIITDT